MCGRFALSLNPPEIEARLKDLQLHVDSWLNQNDYRPNFNLAPQNRAAVVRRNEPKETQLVIDCMKWGLIPHWTESPPTFGENIFNDRQFSRSYEWEALIFSYAQELYSIQSMQEMIKWLNLEDYGTASRVANVVSSCVKGVIKLVLPFVDNNLPILKSIDSFFEWLTKGKEKTPHFTKRTGGQLMCLAGLWDSVTYKGTQDELHTFTIITTSSNKYLSFLHDRMPVILPDRSSMEAWLDTSSSEWSSNLSKLLKPFDKLDGLICYPVPKEVGKVGTQSPDFLKPISQRKGNIMSFFNKQSQKGSQSSNQTKSSLDSKPEKIIKEEAKELESSSTVTQDTPNNFDVESKPKQSSNPILNLENSSMKRTNDDLIDTGNVSSPKKKSRPGS